jgi:hypothetical protein
MKSSEPRLALAIALLVLAAPSRAALERIYELQIEGKRAGYCRYSMQATARGLESRGETVIKVSLLGAPFDMTYRSLMLHSADGKRLLSYRVDFTRGSEAVTCIVAPAGARGGGAPPPPGPAPPPPPPPRRRPPPRGAGGGGGSFLIPHWVLRVCPPRGSPRRHGFWAPPGAPG